jgi:hypothetical protein
LSALKKSINCKEQPIGIVIVAAMMLLLLAGMILAPTQASALSKFKTNTDTSSLKHGIRDGVNVNLQHRDQHMDQENLCYRTNTCRQSDVGQNTLGNDNSITGFADQSDNIQQSAAAPTTTAPANQTTGNQTTGNQTGGGGTTPTTGTLLVKKVEVCLAGGLCPVISEFTITVTGNNPTPPTFAASVNGTLVTLGPGAFNVTETGLVVAGFTVTLSADCTGTIVAGDQKTCTITNTQRQA